MISAKGTFTFARNILDEVFETEATFNNPNRRRTGRPDGTMFDTMLWGTLLMTTSILTVP